VAGEGEAMREGGVALMNGAATASEAINAPIGA